MTNPTPLTWTLRFKSRKTTVLLHVDPLHTFSTIKSHLLTALTETGFRDPETGAQVPLPDSSDEIQLGRPVDINEASRGFRLGEWEHSSGLGSDEDEVIDGKGKGKAKVRPGRKSNGAGASASSVGKDCPKGVGLKDGAVLAFRWAGDGIWDGEDEEGGMWGLRLASFEDAYGVENQVDVGGMKVFEG